MPVSSFPSDDIDAHTGLGKLKSCSLVKPSTACLLQHKEQHLMHLLCRK